VRGTVAPPPPPPPHVWAAALFDRDYFDSLAETARSWLRERERERERLGTMVHNGGSSLK